MQSFGVHRDAVHGLVGADMTETAESQEPILALLNAPATHGGAPVKRIDTHAASVFLAGDRALKVKRAVRFPFLDYSTLEKRKAACEAELEVNRPFAPRPLSRRRADHARARTGGLPSDGRGTPIEWAVEMHRFDGRGDARPAGGSTAASMRTWRMRSAARSRRRMRPQPRSRPAPSIEALADYIGQNVPPSQRRPTLFPRADMRRADDGRAAPPMRASVRFWSSADGAA